VLFKGFVPAAWLGLALSFAVEMTTFLKHAVRMFAQSEGQMASVERLMQVRAFCNFPFFSNDISCLIIPFQSIKINPRPFLYLYLLHLRSTPAVLTQRSLSIL
jgi:hypothetical protein